MARRQDRCGRRRYDDGCGWGFIPGDRVLRETDETRPREAVVRAVVMGMRRECRADGNAHEIRLDILRIAFLKSLIEDGHVMFQRQPGEHLQPQALSIVVVGDPAAVKEPLAQLQRGALETWSATGEPMSKAP